MHTQMPTSICLKSAPPTPTMRIESGRSDAFTKASIVSWRLVTTPSYKKIIIVHEERKGKEKKKYICML